jgi:hypothetical protein
MFVRLLFLLLIALNVGVGAWLLFGDGQVVAYPPPTDPGVPELKLLSERAGALPAQSNALNLSSRDRNKSDRCLTLGPFDTRYDTS